MIVGDEVILIRVSTHASAGDATKQRVQAVPSKAFQLTRPRGTRPSVSGIMPILLTFQLTRPRGTRQFSTLRSPTLRLFQLTRPRGTRPRRRGTNNVQQSFNSRVRGGRDGYIMRRINTFDVSTHASAGDATHKHLERIALRVFQLTRPRGTRRKEFAEGVKYGVSTHASAGDATRAARFRALEDNVSTHASAGDATETPDIPAAAIKFQLTRPRGTRPMALPRKPAPSLFQLTRPRGTRPDACL